VVEEEPWPDNILYEPIGMSAKVEEYLQKME